MLSYKNVDKFPLFSNTAYSISSNDLIPLSLIWVSKSSILYLCLSISLKFIFPSFIISDGVESTMCLNLKFFIDIKDNDICNIAIKIMGIRVVNKDSL